MRTWNRTSIAVIIAMAMLAADVANADWQGTAADLIKSEKPGFGGLSGVTVDRKTGDVYIFLSDKGLYRSTDQGKTWIKPANGAKGAPKRLAASKSIRSPAANA